MPRLSIPTRIFLGFVAVLVAFVAVSLVSVSRYRQTTEALRISHDGYVPLVLDVGQAEAQQRAVMQTLDGVVDDPYTAGTIRITRVQQRKLLDAALTGVRRAGELATSDVDGEVVGELALRLRRVQRFQDAASSDYAALFEALDAGDGDRARGLVAGLAERERRIRNDLVRARALLENRVDQLSLEARGREREALWMLAALTLVALAVGLLVTFWSRRLLLPLPRLQARVSAVARGDLSRRLEPERDDELGRLTAEFERMVDAIAARDRRLREAAQAQRRLERMREQIVADLRTGVLVLDGDDVLRITNPAAERILGVGPGDVGARAASERLGARVPALRDALRRVRGGEPRAVLEAVPLAAEERSVDVLVTPFETLEATPVYAGRAVLVVVDDVTEELRTKARLIQSERLAAIGRMAAHVTHEVRNPLSSIGLNVDLLDDELEGSGEEARSLLRAIHGEIDRLTDVTDEYLRLARLPRPSLVPDDLGDLLRELAAFVGPEMQAAGVALELDVPADLPPVALDEAQLRQALLNLLRNAREAMPGGGRVRVVAREVDDGDLRPGVRLAIEDSGEGIAPEARERIFELFFTTKEQGTGLGLPLTQQIVLAHGGRVLCRGRDGGGTVFELWFPAEAAGRSVPQGEPHLLRPRG